MARDRQIVNFNGTYLDVSRIVMAQTIEEDGKTRIELLLEVGPGAEVKTTKLEGNSAIAWVRWAMKEQADYTVNREMLERAKRG